MPKQPKKLNKIWKVLTEAKKHLAWDRKEISFEDHQYEFICHAVGHVVEEDFSDFALDSSGLVKIIQSRLYPESTYSNWLQDQKGIEVYGHPKYGSKIQISRHAWVDSMIKEFKEKNA